MTQKTSMGLGVRYKRGVAKLASVRHGNPALGLRVIAVAGAAGKTTTAALIAGLLRESGHRVELLVNRQVTLMDGVQGPTEYAKPVQLQRILRRAHKNNVAYVVIEVSQALLESEALSAIALEAVVVTVVYPGYEQSVEQFLSYGTNYAVLPHEHRAERANHLAIAEHQIISFGVDHEADATIGVSRLYRKGTEVHVTIDNQTNFTLSSYLIGSLNARNVAAAIATAYVLGADTATFEEGVARVETATGNYQYIEQGAVYTLVIDGARHGESLKEVVKSARALTKRRLVVVIDGITVSSAVLEAVKANADRVIVTADEDTVRIGVEIANDVKHAVEIALRGARKDDTVLLVGPTFTRAVAGGQLYGETLAEIHHD